MTDRTLKDYQKMHDFFMYHNQKMKAIFNEVLKKNRKEMFKLYKLLKIKMFDRKSILCTFGEMGDRFFIILKGTVGVLVPRQVDEVIFSMFELYTFIINRVDSIKDYKDDHSKLTKKIIDILTPAVLKK